MTSNTVNASPTPQERLAISRKAIIRHMGQAEYDENDEDWRDFDDAEQPRPAADGTWGLVKHAVLAWWRHHPVGVVFDLAKPVVGKYAKEQPLKLLGIAAGIGAAVALLRPWRLLSLGGVLLATLKSSQLSSGVLSMLSAPQVDAATRRKKP